MKVKTSDLTGLALDWAVAGIVHEEKWRHDKYEGGLLASMHSYRPSTDWSQGGPIIESWRITIERIPCGWEAKSPSSGRSWLEGKTALIAAMRAAVSAKIGYEVEVPDELVKAE
jgi:hypothetical protein